MTAADLDRIEATLGVTLPARYRATMLAYPFPPDHDAALWSMPDNADLVLEQNPRPLPPNGRWPAEFVQIGSDGSEESFILDTRSEQGAVLVFELETGKFRPLAPSFDAWLAQLHEWQREVDEDAERERERARRAYASEITTLFRRLTLGVYVVGVADGEQRDAFTAAWLMQTSYDPLLIALSISPEHASYPILKASGVFAVSVLRRGQMELARRFGTHSGREMDKLAGVAWSVGRGGAPILDEALAHLECELTGSLPAGDHEVIVGRVVGGRVLDHDAVPMSYAETGDLDGSSALYPPRF